jgi:WhiB family redox-sensing transcriptional regulator
MDWRFRAACRRSDPELFFPVGNSGPALVQLADAKSVCRRCPVLIECRTWALESGQNIGVWGGMSAAELRAKRRSDRRARRDLHLVRGRHFALQPPDAAEPTPATAGEMRAVRPSRPGRPSRARDDRTDTRVDSTTGEETAGRAGKAADGATGRPMNGAT